MPKTPEGYVLDAVLQWLAVNRILAFRMSVGAVKTDNRFMRFGTCGMADILAFTPQQAHWPSTPVWIECKAGKGKQSPLQLSFQAQVEAEGHRYIVVRSVDDVIALLGS